MLSQCSSATRWIILWVAVASAQMFAQNATITGKASLHRDAKAHSKTIDHLETGERVVLVESSLDSGFYHVRTEDDEIGWVASKFISISSTPNPPVSGMPAGVPVESAAGCDTTLWNHVYHPQRLIVRNQCLDVTGTIVDATNGREPDGVRHEADGDTHGWLKVDSQFANLLNAGNISDEGGNLVFEIVCKYQVTQKDAKAACSNFQNRVIIPAVGTHVKITGTYVQDTFHAQWMEIHPVTGIVAVP